MANVESYLRKREDRLKPKASGPLPRDYRPKIDVSDKLGHEEASHFQSLIEILRCMAELGRVHTCTKVSMISSHLALPRRGHLDALVHMFAYLKTHHNLEMVFSPSDLDLDMDLFPRED